MYFPSPLPVTRLSLATSFTPLGPSSASRPSTPYRTPGRPPKGKFKGDALGGVQEEEGEQVLAIVAAPTDPNLWATLGREDVAVWSHRPAVVLAKLKRSPISLRTHGSNAHVAFHSDARLVVTTTTGHSLLYKITPLGRRVYALPGGDKAREQWPRGPGEGPDEIPGVALEGDGERSIQVGDGIGCVCVTGLDLIVSVLDPPSLRIIPFPSPPSSSSSSSSSFPTPAPTSPPALSRLSRFPSTISLSATPTPSVSMARRGSGWEGSTAGQATTTRDSQVVVLDDWDWLVGRDRSDVTVTQLVDMTRSSDAHASATTRRKRFVMLTSDGRAYDVEWRPPANSTTTHDYLFDLSSENDEGGRGATTREREWFGTCFHPDVTSSDSDGGTVDPEAYREKALDRGKGASTACYTDKMGLVAIGSEDGTVSVYSIPPRSASPLSSDAPPVSSHTHSLLSALNTTSSHLSPGRVTCLAYTSDGLALAVGWDRGWSVWSVFGRLASWSTQGGMTRDEGAGYGVEGEKGMGFEDHFLAGVRQLFWATGDTELVVLCPPPVHPKKKPHDEQLFVVPFAKSAVTTAHTPDNTKNAFLQLEDRVMVYRGADQPDLSVINPESDVWQHVKFPLDYIARQYPIRYCAISSDARLIAVAGRRGLTHFNALSGRWKLFERSTDEDAFRVVGGMSWWGPILIAGTTIDASRDGEGGYGLRLFSRDQPLTLAASLATYPLDSEPVVLSVFDSSLLVYTKDNTFYHFLIRHPPSGPQLKLCGSIGFEGVVSDPTKVRGISWLVPKSQQRFGDPADDLNVATIIFLISGRLVLLRPRRAASQEVKYDLQLLSSSIEFFWTHLSGIGTLENSLWGYGEGRKIQIWLDALTIEKVRVDRKRDMYESVKESVAIELDFYPLAVLMEKGIVVGVDQEINLRKSLDFALFRVITTTHLFLDHILRFHLTRGQSKEAVLFASHYQHLVYFSHSLEKLLHGVLEDEADAALSSSAASPEGIANRSDGQRGVLPSVVEFLDHFDECLQVVVNCARKTEVARWEFLFNVVGKPRDLFEKCIASGFLKVAASYLLVLHNLEPVEQSSKDTVRLLTTAMQAEDWNLCRELLRFLYSLDRTGTILRAALSESSALPNLFPHSLTKDPRRIVSSPAPPSYPTTSDPTPRFQGLGKTPSGANGTGQRTPSMPPRPTSGGTESNGFESLLGRMM
ncbi:hypothetical protein JCM11491_006569 [Sporobolomyces phaffii]